MRLRRSVPLVLPGLVVIAAGVLIASCADQTGPRQPIPGRFALAPGFVSAQAGIVPVGGARVVLTRVADGTVARDTVIAIAAGSDSVDLAIGVAMLAPDEVFLLTLTLMSPAGDTVFRAGPIEVRPTTSGPPAIVQPQLVYVGVGANAAAVVLQDPTAPFFSGDTLPVVAVALDSSGAPIPGTPIGWRSLDSTIAQVPAPGQGRVVGRGVRGAARIVAQLLTGPADTTSVTVALPPAALTAESGGGQSGPAGGLLPTPLVARVTASDGVGIAGQWIRFAATLGGGALSADSALTDATGRASVSWTLGNVVGAQTVTATTARLPGVTATFGATSVATGPGAITIVAGNAQSALVGTAVATAPQVRVTDTQGNPVPGVTVTFVVTQGGGAVTGGTPVTDGNGLAAVGSWTLGPMIGLNALTATVTGLTPLQFVALGTGTGGATSMTISAGNGQTALAGTAVPIPPAVLVTDTSGAPIVGVTVTFAVTAGGGSLTGAAAVTNASGVATVGSWTLGTPGSNTLTASLTGLPTVAFTATATVGPPATVVIISGNNQSADAGTALPQPLVVEVRDVAGNPVPGVTVAFATLNGSVAPTAGTTDAAGRAQTIWTLSTNTITQTATATVSGLTPVVFTATALFPNPSILLTLVGTDRIRLTDSATLDVTLTAPAPAGGVVVLFSVDNSAVVGLDTTDLFIPQNGTATQTKLYGLSAGTTTVRATATGYADGAVSVLVTVQVLSMPTTLNVPFGGTASLPLQISTPAPAGGVMVTVVSSNPAAVGVLTPTVTIPQGQQTANATVSGVTPGGATVTGSTVDFGTAQSTVSTTASLNIVESSATLNASFGTNVTVRLESGGSPIAAPAPGITVTLTAGDPTCLAAPAQAVIPTGLVSVTVPLTYGGSATLPCATTLGASSPNITPDNINVTVNPAPPLTLFNQTVGSGLQYFTSGSLGAPAPAGTVVRVTSADPAAVLVAPNASTPGTAFIDLALTPGATSFSYYIQGLESTTGAVTVTATATGYTNGTATMTVAQPALDIIFLATSTTSLSTNDAFQVRIGVPNGTNQFMSIEQAIRAGGTAVTATVTNSDGTAAQLVTQAQSGNTVTTTIAVGQARSPGSVAAGGVEFDPLNAGTTRVDATIPSFIALPSASVSVTITAPALTLFNQTVGSGLQYFTSGSLGAPAPAGTVVRVTSADPAAVLVAPNASTPGTAFIDLALTPGATSFSYYIQGLESTTGAVTVTATATGYTNGTATMTVAQPALDIIFLATSTTSLSTNDAFQVRIGVPNGTNQFMSIEQAIRAGGTAVTATVTTSNAGVGQLVTEALTGGTVTTTIAVGQTRSPGSVAAGGIEFDPLTAGTTTVSATIPSFVALPSASVTVTVSTPGLTLFDRTVGGGLQDFTSGSLGAPAPAGTVVRITSSNPGVVLVAADASTPGTAFIDIALGAGVNSFGYYVQGVEGATGTVSLTATASGYTDGSTTVTVVQPAVDIIFLTTSTTVGAADDPFQVRIGVPNPTNQFMSIEQAVRAGGSALTATVTSSDGTVAQLVTQSVTGSSVTVPIAIGQARSPSTVATGGVAFDPLAVGSSTVATTIPGFVSLPTASVTVTVNP